MKLNDKVIIITGGASGLGRAACQKLLGSGAKVAVFDLCKTESFSRIESESQNLLFLEVDVTDEDSVVAAVSKTKEVFGSVHVCINCAGIASGGRTVGRGGALPLDQFAKVINVNLVGTFNVLRVAAEFMSKNEPDAGGERGVIINTASVAAFDGQLGQAAYSASKSGIVGMTLPIARDLAQFGIRVMAIAPGIFETEMMKGLAEKVTGPLIGMVQSPKRLGDPDEYADLATHIIQNSYLNGEVIRLDGAIRMASQ